ncbi:MAG: hypothetical protein K940chlam9_01051 [Chlamydiae bacterium]|nr:hypothetical protein [Chlamydiota bacterium]
MIKRDFWIKKIEKAWKKRSIIWLAGVRRAGKTCLCQSLDGVEYFDCELPRVRRVLEDPEAFLRSMLNRRLILDEIHRLPNPSELLKIAADHYPSVRILATGSSTLGASKKFRDTLTGRKEKIHLPPMLYHELADFDEKTFSHRLLFGGLPPFFLADELIESDYQEWLSSYWAKDIQELYHLEKKYSFMRFTELLLAQSGSMFEASRFASPCEVSRTTISSYLSVLETTYVAYIVRPFSTHPATEIISAPKVYGFDTGFVSHAKGWVHLRNEDLGQLWEHIILNELTGQLQGEKILYWRDKRDHEIDFVLERRRKDEIITIECKWNSSNFTPNNMKKFRARYPKGENYVVGSDLDRPFVKKYEGVEVHFVSLPDLILHLSS